MRLIDRRKVDFPHPDGPMRAVIALDRMSRSMSNSACFSPYQKENCRAASAPRLVTGAPDPDGWPRAVTSTVAAVIRTVR